MICVCVFIFVRVQMLQSSPSPSNPVFSLPFTFFGRTASTQSSPLSPFLSALEAVSREPGVPLLAQVHCMQSLALCLWTCMHQPAWPADNFWGFPNGRVYQIHHKCIYYRRGRPLPDGSRGHGYVQGPSHSNHFLSQRWCVYREGCGTGCIHKGKSGFLAFQ